MNKTNNFSEKTVYSDPFIQFGKWYEEHLAAGQEIPEAVSLGTATKEGHVSVRTVLLKEFNENGFIFFTNYNSRKSSHLNSNPNAALLFYWTESGRQVRVEGVTEKIPAEDSEIYFQTRPKESQLSAWASEQSKVIPDRQFLENRFQYYKKQFEGMPVRKPEHWGGFRLIPHWLEFWQNGEFRLHDRVTYTKKNSIWIIERLAP